jgi:hypothetical protein
MREDDFDYRALAAAVEKERVARGLTNQELLRQTWMTSGVLKRMTDGQPTTCQHATILIRWLGRTPESFMPGIVDSPEHALPEARGYVLRWSLPLIHEALEVKRHQTGMTWSQVAEVLGCSPSQVQRIDQNRYGIAMDLAMRIARWVDRPAASFLYKAEPLRPGHPDA